MGSREVPKTNVTDEELLEMAQRAVMDSPMQCPYCQATVYESDYDNCGGCGKENPLKAIGW